MWQKELGEQKYKSDLNIVYGSELLGDQPQFRVKIQEIRLRSKIFRYLRVQHLILYLIGCD